MRQRIVINLDAPKNEGSRSVRKRRRWPRVLAILVLLGLGMVVVAAAGGFFWWRHYQSTPAYALTCLVDAAQRNDRNEFQKYVNDDELAKNMVASVSQKAAARYGYALNSSIQQQIDGMLPALLPGLKQTIHDEAMKEIQALASKSEPQPFILLLVTVPRLMTVSTEGNTAKVKAPLINPAFELTMQRADDRWQVTELKDETLVQRVVDSVMKQLPAIGSVDANSPLLKQATKRHKRRR